MPKQIEGMHLSFKRRTAANHALRKTGFSRSPPVHRTNPEGQVEPFRSLEGALLSECRI